MEKTQKNIGKQASVCDDPEFLGGPDLVCCVDCEKIRECYDAERKRRKKITEKEREELRPRFDFNEGGLTGDYDIECDAFEEG